MKFLEAARTVFESKTAMLIRPRKGADREYDLKPMFSGKKSGWVLMDLFTASAVVAVADRVAEDVKLILNSLPPVKAAAICMKAVS